MSFIKRLALCSFALATFATTGCIFSKKPDSAIAAGNEAEYMEKWVQHRINELMASGGATDALQARRQAQDEFRTRFKYAIPAKR